MSARRPTKTTPKTLGVRNPFRPLPTSDVEAEEVALRLAQAGHFRPQFEAWVKRENKTPEALAPFFAAIESVLGRPFAARGGEALYYDTARWWRAANEDFWKENA